MYVEDGLEIKDIGCESSDFYIVVIVKSLKYCRVH